MKSLVNIAAELYDEYKNHYTFYGNRKRAGFTRRLKNVAAQIDVKALAADEMSDEAVAALALDVIATRMGISVLFRDEL